MLLPERKCKTAGPGVILQLGKQQIRGSGGVVGGGGEVFDTLGHIVLRCIHDHMSD